MMSPKTWGHNLSATFLLQDMSGLELILINPGLYLTLDDVFQDLRTQLGSDIHATRHVKPRAGLTRAQLEQSALCPDLQGADKTLTEIP